MYLSEALDLINANHPDGAVEFYSKMKDDPWQKAHDTLEASLKSPGSDTEVAIQAFYAEIRRLQDLFKQSGIKQKAEPWNIGFHSPSKEEAAARSARQEQVCVGCGTTKKLKFVSYLGKATPTCAACASRFASNGQMPLF